VSYEDRKLTWNSGVRKVIRRGSAEGEVRKHRDRVTGENPMAAKETIGDGGGRKYADSQFSDQNR